MPSLVARRSSLTLALAVFFVGGAARADGFSFTKGPYLQGLGQRSVVVRWEGFPAAPATVTVTRPGGPAREIKTAEATSFHSVELTGLEPGTTYGYVVKANETRSADGHFTTAPEATKPFTFLAYGDNRSDAASHEAIVKAMLRVPSDFLVHSGDMVLEGNVDDDWNAFFAIEAPLLRDRCVFACVGNHELIGRGEPPFLRYFHPAARGEKTLTYSVRWSNARFFFLNAMAPWDAGADKAWIERELTAADAEAGVDHRFVVLHHSPFSTGPHGDNASFDRAGIPEMLRAHKVSLVLAGHDHVYERGEKDGLRYLITGGGGAPLYPQGKKRSAATIAFESAFHFVEVAVDGKALTTTARRPDGSILERCAIPAEGPWTCEGLAPLPKPPPPPTTPTSPDPPKKSCACAMPGTDARGSTPPFALGSALLALVVRSRLRRRRQIS